MTIDNTLFVGKVLLRFPELDSTNKYAQELLSKSLPIEGTVITTPNQTYGRGQIGSKWESQAHKNISLSAIFYPTFLSPKDQFALNIVSSLAVSDLIRTFSELPVRIKWPNDIYIKDKKTSGILIQNSISGSKIHSSIIGIGINVNQNDFGQHLPFATSLARESHKQYDLDALIAALCQKLEQYYLALKQAQYDTLKEQYLNQLYRKDELHSFIDANGQLFQGIIRGIGPFGKLMIEHNGSLNYFQIKEVAFADSKR